MGSFFLTSLEQKHPFSFDTLRQGGLKKSYFFSEKVVLFVDTAGGGLMEIHTPVQISHPHLSKETTRTALRIDIGYIEGERVLKIILGFTYRFTNG